MAADNTDDVRSGSQQRFFPPMIHECELHNYLGQEVIVIEDMVDQGERDMLY